MIVLSPAFYYSYDHRRHRRAVASSPRRTPHLSATRVGKLRIDWFRDDSTCISPLPSFHLLVVYRCTELTFY